MSTKRSSPSQMPNLIRAPRGPVRKKPAPMALEARLMFDGAALTTVATTPEHVSDAAHTDAAPADTGSVNTAPAAVDTSKDRPVDGAAAASSAPREVAFIDTTVPQWQTLVKDIRSGVEVILLDPTRDGLSQIAAALEARSGIDAVHIVSHGADGALVLGGQSYTADNLNQHQAELDAIAHALSVSGDLLLYGCDIGKGSVGEAFMQRIAAATQADVAASTNTTGGTAAGGDWTLEASVGPIEAKSLATAALLADYDARLNTISLAGNTGWVPVMIGTNFDPVGDSQAGAADTDLVGDATHAAMYVAFDDGGTSGSASDDYMLFRIRVDNPTSSTNFGGVAIVGIDANLDGRIDLFFAVDGRNNAQRVQLMDPGTGLNNSPSNTTTSPLPNGWLPNNGIYPFSAANYAVTAVSATSDPNWNGDNDLGNDGKTDVFVTFKIPLSDVATVLAIPSPADRQGVVGPRGSNGIQGFDENTMVRYVLMSQTQPGPINGDLGGVGNNYDKNATFEQLGTFTAPMSPADPIPAGATLTVGEPVGDGNLSAAEDASVTIAGTSANLANGTNLTITISDTNGGTPDVTASATVNNNAWSVSGVNLSGLADGTLTITAQTSSGVTVLDTATVLHDRTAPVIGIVNGTAYNDTTPTITGTTDLPVGSVVTVTVDPDNDGSTNNNLVYTTTVLAGGVWSIDTGVVAPISGAFPVAGLPAYSKVTASGTDAAGNSTTTAALNKPTVNSLTTNRTTPTISGSWTNLGGDTLTVTVNGTTYTTSTGVAISGNTWSLTTNTLSVGTYNVTATVTRSGTSTSDATSGELVVVSGPAVSITGGASATTNNASPTIAGTSTVLNGFITARIDPGNDGVLTDAVTYSVTTDGSGNWSLNTATATPISGYLPAGGLTAANGVLASATDNTGTATAAQALTVTTPTVHINTPISGGYFNDAEDNSASISGTTTNVSDGQTVTVQVTDGDTTVSGSATVTGGAWTASGLNLSSLKEGTLTISATKGSGSDTATVVHDTMMPIAVDSKFVSGPRPSFSGVSDSSTVNISIDVYKKSGASIVFDTTVTYNNVSVSSGTWTLDTNTATPSSGTMPVNALNNTGEYFAVTVTGTDTAGNIGTATGHIERSGTSGTVSIGTIAGDNVITEAEDNSVTISGTTSVAAGVVKVTVTDGTNTLTQTVTAVLGSWSTSSLNLDTFKDGAIVVKAELLVSAVDTRVIATAISEPTHTNASTAAPTVTISDNVPGLANGNVTFTFNFSQDVTGFDATDVTVSGGAKGTFTAVNAHQYTLVVAPTAGVNSGTITVDVGANAAQNGAAIGNTAATQATQAYDTLAPALAITAGASATDSTPVITGTTDLPAGATITITIDPNNDGVLTDQVTYAATVQTGGTWSVNTETATPTSGTLGAGGLTPYAKITATGADAAGNSTTTTGLNRPTANTLTTNDTTPTLSGYWTNLGGDTLTVTVNGTTYTTGSGVAISGNTWTLTTNALGGGTYNVTATATRGGTSINDATSGELVVDTTGPAVAITSSTATADTTPVISGTTDLPDGTVLAITIDPDNDAGTNNSFTYSVVAAGGAWSVDTGTALPTSGSFPASGLAGTIGVTASGTDTAGNTTMATQTLLVDNVAPVIGITTNASTRDTTPLISGTSDLPQGSTLTLQIDPDNDGDYSNAYTFTLTVGVGGTWSVDTGTVAPDGLGSTVTLSGTVGLKASGSDTLGNTAIVSKSLTIDTSAPALTVSAVGDGDISATEDNSVLIQGTTTDIPNGSTLTVTITDGTHTILDTATVNSNAWSLAAIDLSSLNDGQISVTASYTDGNGDTFIATGSFDHDKTPPTVVLTSTTSTISGVVNVASATVTATFTEVVSGLTASDFAASNGAVVSNLVQVDGTHWTFTLTPAVNGTTSVWLPAAQSQDAAGNDNALSSALDFTVNVGVADTIAPTVTSVERQSPSASLTNADSVTFRVTFSESMLGVDTADFALSGAAAGSATVQSVTAVGGQVGVYDVVVSGIASANGALTLGLSGGQNVTDAASNALTNTTPSLSESYALDNIAPALAAVNGATVSFTSLVLSYDENLAGATPATGDFAVMANGSTSISVTGVSVNTVSDTVTLTLASAVIDTDIVTVSYTPGANKTQDLAGNTAVGFSNHAVVNNTPSADSTAPAGPTLALLAASDSGQSNNDATTSDDTPTVRVTLNGAGSAAPLAGDVVKVFSGGAQVGVAILAGSDISAGYVDITTNALGADGAKSLTATITDAANNVSNDSNAVAVALDTTAPGLASAVANGGALVLTYDETLGTATPVAADFSVSINGSATAPSAVVVDTAAKTVTLTLSSPAGIGDTVTVTYTPGTNKTQDVAGNFAASMNAQAVSNVTGDTTPPTLVSFDDGDADNAVIVGDTLTYTVTFSEDIDASTVTAADFGNAGSAGVTIGAIAETSPGVFSVDVATTSIGTLKLKVNAGAMIKDSAGNNLDTSSAIVDGTTVNVLPDTTAPADPGIALLSTSDSGQSTNDLVTSVDTPTVRVTLNGSGATAPIAGDTVTVYEGAAQVGTAALSGADIAAGYVDITTSALGADGAKSLTATVTDAASNASGASSALDVTLDTTAPSLASATANGTTLVLTYDETLGTATPLTGAFSVDVNGSTITPTGATVDAVAGTVTLTLPSAVNFGDTVSVSYTPGASKTQDVAGNFAASLANQSVSNTTPDTTPPTVVSFDDGDADNAVIVGDTLTYTVTFSEDIDASTVTAADFGNAGSAGVTIGAITETSPGVFSVDVATTSPGTLVLQVNAGATIKDTAGNDLDTSAAIADDTTVAVNDVTAPAPPTLTLVTSSDSGESNSDLLTNDDTPTVRVTLNGAGSAAPLAGDVVKVFSGVVQVGTATLSAGDISNGYVDVTANALGADGVKNLTATVTDAANNASSASNTLALALDRTAPGMASIDDNDADDSVNEGDTLTYTVSFNEDIDASTVTAADFGNAGTAGITIGTITETSRGVFSVQVTTTSPGTLTLQVNNGAVIRDAAGNVLDTSSAVADDTTVTVNDITAPAAPSLALLAASDSGSNNGDRITNDDTPSVRVTLNGAGATAPVAGDVVKIYLGASQVGTATLASTDIGNGYVDITTSALGADGAKSLTATVTDVSNNASGASSALALTLDTAAPTLSSASVNGASLVLTYNESLDAAAPAIGDFSVDVNGTVVTPIGISVNGAAHTVTLTLFSAVNNGDSVSVAYTPGASKTQDVAGNFAASLSNQSVSNNTPDTTPPTVVSFDDGDADNIVNRGDTLTYTITFSEDIDNTTVTAASFGNAGTAGVTIGAITEVSPGVFTVQVTAATTGTLQLRINAGAVITDATGNALNTSGAVVDPTVVTVNAPASAPTSPSAPPEAPPPRPESPPPSAPPVAAPAPFEPSPDRPGFYGSDLSASGAQGFASQLGLVGALDPLRPVASLSSFRADSAARNAAPTSRPIDDVYTSRGENAFSIAVVKANEPSLLVYRGIPDQEFSLDKPGAFKVPVDAFVHTNPKAVVTLRATLLDGRPLPKWLRFDPQSGKFEGKPPVGTPNVLSILVVARDADGREASTIFRIRLDKASAEKPGGRASLSEQLRSAATRDRHAERYAGLYAKRME